MRRRVEGTRHVHPPDGYAVCRWPADTSQVGAFHGATVLAGGVSAGQASTVEGLCRAPEGFELPCPAQKCSRAPRQAPEATGTAVSSPQPADTAVMATS